MTEPVGGASSGVKASCKLHPDSRPTSATPGDVPTPSGNNRDGATCRSHSRRLPNKQIVVAVCAMHKKVTSRPMEEILSRMREYYGNELDIVVFHEDMIVNQPVHEWPPCDCFISFYSRGFPINKAIEYVRLRNPYVINDLERQYDLMSRIKVYKTLERAYIEVPRYKVLLRDADSPSDCTLIEHEDSVEVKGIVFNKPFVEKPISAENHNIYIYYPSSAGGGSQRLFRKVDNRSSFYSPDSRVRKDGSYIYEEFMPTDGTDVKVYAVGLDYAHAEARKSPALDGKVERDSDGKEIRYPVILTSREKLIARKIVWAFKQSVCGFDLLRANGRSYVCDVNGFSFVKTSSRYYEDSAKILGNMILRHLAPTLQIPWVRPFQLDDPPLVTTTYGTVMELRCVLAVIRHGDRTPKQKLKMEVRHPKFIALFHKYNGPNLAELKLKRPAQLQEVLDIVRHLLAIIRNNPDQAVSITEQRSKLEQVKTVLEMHGHFSGINRKVQMKYQTLPKNAGHCRKKSSNGQRGRSLLLIVKWGGELTNAGKIQAEELGKAFRCLYPGGHYGSDSRGLGFLRLHSTYRHDLKIYASEEGRVQMTAAAFAKGLLALEGELPPILVQMVKSANTDGLLDDDKDARMYQTEVKSFLHSFFQQDKNLMPEDEARINPTNSITIQNALRFIRNPKMMCCKIYDMVKRMFDIIKTRRMISKCDTLYMGETWDLIERRWGKLVKDFCCANADGTVDFDISKIPDIYDCIKYDLEHNFGILLAIEHMEELYVCSKHMADIVVFQEYGVTADEKVSVATGICTPLIRKLKSDVNVCVGGVAEEENSTRLDPSKASKDIATPLRHVRTRLYFTSESHIHSLLNLFQFGNLVEPPFDTQWQNALKFLSSVTEFNYMSQMVLMLYEDMTKDPRSEDRFHVELHFSPGALPCIQTTHVAGLGYRPKASRNGNDDTTSQGRDPASVSISEKFEQPLTPSDDAANPTSKSSQITNPIRIVSIEDKGNKPITTEELALHSPTRTISPDRTTVAVKPISPTHISIRRKAECEDQPNYYLNIVAVEELIGAGPYNQVYPGLRRQTASYIAHSDAKLISTAVISGSFSSTRDATPALMSTAVISRGSSVPDLRKSLMLLENGERKSSEFEVNFQGDAESSFSRSSGAAGITFMVPPLRSLETLHNQLSLNQIDRFFERIVTTKSAAAQPVG